VLVLVIALFTYYRSKTNRRSKIIMPRVSGSTRDLRESEPLGMTKFPSVNAGDPFVEYRGEQDEDLGAPERSPVEGREDRSRAEFLRSDAESIP
jgi:hypothetical protein